MSQVFQRGPASPEMNLTPLIDVVFLLIIFFMLVNQIVAERNVKMIVPAPHEPNTRQLSEDDNPVIVNVAPQPYTAETRPDPLRHPGQAAFVQVGSRRFALGQLAELTAALRNEKAARPDVQVVVRSDMAIFYEDVQPVIEAVRASGIERVDLAAFTEEAGYDFE